MKCTAQITQTKPPVHLCDFPEVNHELRNFELEEEMADTQAVVKLGHSLRKEHKIKVRQPLASAHIVCVDNKRLLALKRQEKLICEELNVHKVEFSDKEEGFVEFICKPNFRVLGKKVGSKMRSVQKIIKGFSREQLQVFIDGGSLEIEAELETFTLTLEDVQVERRAYCSFRIWNYNCIGHPSNGRFTHRGNFS